MKVLTIFDLNLGLKMAHDTFLMKMCHSLANAGDKVYFLVGSGDTLTDIWGYYGLPYNSNLEICKIPRVHRKRIPLINLNISITKVFNFFCMKKIENIYRREGIDVAYLSGLKPAELFLKLQKKIPVPYVYEVHQIFSEDYPRSNFFGREYAVLKNAYNIITTTTALKEKLKSIYGLMEHQIKVAHLATDIVDYDTCIPDYNAKVKNICYFGQLYPLQGIEVAIESLRHLEQTIQLHILGGTNDRIDELATFAKKMGVGNRVVFHGFVPPSKLRAEVIKLNPILIMPSLSIGRMDYVAHSKIYEYLSYGFPIVASDLSSVREVFLNINAAVLVKPNSAKDLANGIQLILQNQVEAKKLGILAKELSKKYSWKERATTLSKIFGSVSKR